MSGSFCPYASLHDSIRTTYFPGGVVRILYDLVLPLVGDGFTSICLTSLPISTPASSYIFPHSRYSSRSSFVFFLFLLHPSSSRISPPNPHPLTPTLLLLRLPSISSSSYLHPPPLDSPLPPPPALLTRLGLKLRLETKIWLRRVFVK